MPNYVYWLVIGCILTVSASAQSPGRISYSLEVGGLATSGPQTPFWLRANQYGTVPLRGSFGTFRPGITKDYRPKTDTVANRKTRRFDWGFGLNAVVNTGQPTVTDKLRLFLPEAFVKVRVGQLELYGGNRKEVIGLGDTVLTSGNVAWSGNALPFPKIQLHTPDFVPLGFTRKLIAFKAGFAHGWFINAYIRGSYLHQKYMYGRLGKPHWRVRFYAGLNHQVQWGGSADYLVGTELAVNGQLPTSFRDYLSMLIGHYPDDLQNKRFTEFDGTNRIGNHIGSYDVAFEWNGKTHNWLLYHQHIYEDASGLALQNIPDGLTGLRYLNRKSLSKAGFRVRRLVVEWLTTTNQSGAKFDPTARFQGGDNYFNHSQYREGWTYRGHTLGTPLLMPYTNLSTYAVNLGGPFFPNNRVIAWYTGLESSFRRGPALQLRTSYSRNLGSFNRPYPRAIHQFSALASAQWPLGKRAKTHITTSLAMDRGELLPNSMGGFLSFRKVW